MIKVSPMFSDHMVLQRFKNISVFGTGDEGERVTVTLGGDTAETRVRGGRWTAVLPAQKTADGAEMTVSADGFSRTFTDIAIGEVWLAGGQSNMEYELQNCTTGKQHLENDAGVNVRYYYTQKIVNLEPRYEEVITNNAEAVASKRYILVISRRCVGHRSASCGIRRRIDIVYNIIRVGLPVCVQVLCPVVSCA